VDIGLGLLFFIVGKVTGNLTTAALVGAGAGLAVVVVQRFVKADLLGGLAMFGVFTLLLSAGFSLWFQDERMVQLKGSILGVFIASLILADALLNRGRYFGARLARYLIGMSVDARRLALGMALLGLTMAGLNLLATLWLSKDAWLFYTTFVDAPWPCCWALVFSGLRGRQRRHDLRRAVRPGADDPAFARGGRAVCHGGHDELVRDPDLEARPPARGRLQGLAPLPCTQGDLVR